MISTIYKAAFVATLLVGAASFAHAQTNSTLGAGGSAQGSGSIGTTIDTGKSGTSAGVGAGAGVDAKSSSSVGVGGADAKGSTGAGASTSGSADIAVQPLKK